MHRDQPTFEVDGRKIRKRRMEAGLTTAQLATATGCSRVYLSHIEVGIRRRMGPTYFAALRAALDAQIPDLLLNPPQDAGETERTKTNGTPQDAPRRP